MMIDAFPDLKTLAEWSTVPALLAVLYVLVIFLRQVVEMSKTIGGSFEASNIVLLETMRTVQKDLGRRNETIEELREKMKKCEDKIENLEELAIRRAEKIDELESKLEERNKEIQKLQARIKSLETSGKEKDDLIAALRKELDDIRKDRDATKQDRDELQKQLDDIKAQIGKKGVKR